MMRRADRADLIRCPEERGQGCRRLRDPRGVGVVQLLSGIHRNIAADVTVAMSESHPALRAGWVRTETDDLPR
jgi:hypothetical protein